MVHSCKSIVVLWLRSEFDNFYFLFLPVNAETVLSVFRSPRRVNDDIIMVARSNTFVSSVKYGWITLVSNEFRNDCLSPDLTIDIRIPCNEDRLDLMKVDVLTSTVFSDSKPARSAKTNFDSEIPAAETTLIKVNIWVREDRALSSVAKVVLSFRIVLINEYMSSIRLMRHFFNESALKSSMDMVRFFLKRSFIPRGEISHDDTYSLSSLHSSFSFVLRALPMIPTSPSDVQISLFLPTRVKVFPEPDAPIAINKTVVPVNAILNFSYVYAKISSCVQFTSNNESKRYFLAVWRRSALLARTWILVLGVFCEKLPDDRRWLTNRWNVSSLASLYIEGRYFHFNRFIYWWWVVMEYISARFRVEIRRAWSRKRINIIFAVR